MTIAQMQRNINAIAERFNEQRTIIVMELQTEMLTRQKERLFAGYNADGTPITPEYTAFTVKMKQEKGQPHDRVTLKDTGEFYDTMFMEVINNDEMLFDSKDWKSGELKAKYGEAIFGIADTDKEALREMAAEKLKEWMNEMI